jgi:hypothetical protein
VAVLTKALLNAGFLAFCTPCAPGCAPEATFALMAADLKAAETALADHFAQEHVDERHPTDLHNNLAAARNRAEQPWAQRREGKPASRPQARS